MIWCFGGFILNIHQRNPGSIKNLPKVKVNNPPKLQLQSQEIWITASYETACWDVVVRAIVFEIHEWQSNVHFPWPNELTICPDNGFQTFVTAILSAYLLHKFILNVKCRMDWSWNNILPMEHVWLRWICHLPLTSLKELNFPWLILIFSDLFICPLQGKE